ncbi:MAG: hypothetical protein Q9168_003578 [Polycauliona sp. 1 TL-2023]
MTIGHALTITRPDVSLELEPKTALDPPTKGNFSVWPLDSPAPISVLPSNSTSKLTGALPECNGRLYGRNLKLSSCMQLYHAMSSYTAPQVFGERGTGYYDAPLPFRYLSHDGLCAIDLAHSAGVLSDTVSPVDLKVAARLLISVCVGQAPNEGGLITGLGEKKALALRIVPYRPMVTCGPPNSGPPWISCRDIIDSMPANNKKQVFGPSGDARTTVELPWKFTTTRQRCGVFVNGIQPGRTIDTGDWYKIWAAANAVEFMCTQLGKNGSATSLVGQDLGFSSLPDLPDQDLTYDAQYLPGTLSSIASFMACVAAMHELALLEKDSFIGDNRIWFHPGYPEVSVTMVEVEGCRSTARWAMWLIQAAIRDIMIRSRYQTAEFLGQYRKVKIGIVQILKSRHPVPLDMPQQSSIAGATKPSTSNDVSFKVQKPNGTGSTILADPYDARVNYLDKPMDMRDTFFSLIWLLMAFGTYGHMPLRVFHISFLTITTEVRTIWNRVPHSPSGEPPLTAADMVNMVASLAVVLARDLTFKEMNVFVIEKGVLIARGAIRTEALPRGLVLPMTSNVTVL